MPTEPIGNSHVDQLLTDFAIAYGQDPAKHFVGDVGATMLRKTKQSDKYPVWSKADFYRSEMGLVGHSTPAPIGGFRVDLTNTFYADEYALKVFLADKDAKGSDLDIRKQKVRYLVGQAKLKRDKLYAAAVFATGKWTSNTEQTGKAAGPGANEFLQFGDASSDPLIVIQNQLLAVELSTGLMPNVMITNSVVDMALRRHPDILDLYKYTSGGLATRDEVAEAVGVSQIVVGHAVENTANEGQAATMARVFGNHILLAYIEPGPSQDLPTAISGYTWNEYDKVDATGVAIKTWREDDPEGEWLKAEQCVQYKITANDLGVFLKDAVI